MGSKTSRGRRWSHSPELDCRNETSSLLPVGSGVEGRAWNKLAWTPLPPRRWVPSLPKSDCDHAEGDITWMSDFWPPGKGQCAQERMIREEGQVVSYLQVIDTVALSVQTAAGTLKQTDG